MDSKSIKIAWTIFAVLAAHLLSCTSDDAAGRRLDSNEDQLHVLADAPAFEGVTQNNVAMSSAELEGSIWVASFMFTSCGGSCPVMNSNLAKLQDEFADIENLTFVSFTVDPERDSVSVLKSYAAKYGARDGRWQFVHMPKDAVAKLSAQGFLLGNVDSPAMHSSRFALVDRDGKIRGYFDGLDEEAMQKLRKALRSLANGEAAHS